MLAWCGLPGRLQRCCRQPRGTRAPECLPAGPWPGLPSGAGPPTCGGVWAWALVPSPAVTAPGCVRLPKPRGGSHLGPRNRSGLFPVAWALPPPEKLAGAGAGSREPMGPEAGGRTTRPLCPPPSPGPSGAFGSPARVPLGCSASQSSSCTATPAVPPLGEMRVWGSAQGGPGRPWDPGAPASLEWAGGRARQPACPHRVPPALGWGAPLSFPGG